MIKVTYIDHMGSDLSVVNAARVSFGKKSEALGTSGVEGEPMTPILNDPDKRLIKYLAKHKHMAPIFVARQLVKHKFLRWNEISRRYVDDEPEFYEPDVWRGRADDKKQGSAGAVESVPVGALKVQGYCLAAYQDLLSSGICPEQARMVLPQSTMTEWYWSGSLDAFADMCNLRCKGDTQLETRLVANQICDSMHKLFPLSWKALRGLY
jgi:thymidylate synthase (FAD)